MASAPAPGRPRDRRRPRPRRTAPATPRRRGWPGRRAAPRAAATSRGRRSPPGRSARRAAGRRGRERAASTSLGLPREHPHEADHAVAGLLDGHDTRLLEDEACGFERVPVPRLVVRSEEHRRAQPVGFDLVVGVRGPERGEEPAAGRKPAEDPLEERALLRTRDVAEQEERDNGVEALRLEGDLRRIGPQEPGFRNEAPRTLELPLGDVDPDDVVPSGERARRRPAAAAAEVEDPRALRQPLLQHLDPAQRRGLERRGPLRVALGDRVVAAPDHCFRRLLQTRSTTAAIAWPKPMHIEAIPYRASRRSSSFRSVAVIRAPVAPSGCPSEIPPPFGFTSSIRSSSPASRTNWSTTDAKASFTSTTPTSSQPRPALASAFAHPAGLPCSMRCGSTPARPNETKRARGSRSSRSTARPLATSTAAAPSQIWLEFPAVILPSGRKAGRSAASASRDVSARGVSSVSTRTPTCGFETSTGTISFANRPSSDAATARRCDSSEYASSSSRVSPHSSAITSAEMPSGTISKRSSKRWERSPPLDPIGTRDIISTPAATTRSRCPAFTAAAAFRLPCT